MCKYIHVYSQQNMAQIPFITYTDENKRTNYGSTITTDTYSQNKRQT